jgi:hypothetical protein
MEKREKKRASTPCPNWLSLTFHKNRPPCISIHAPLSDFLQKFTRGFCFFSDPLVNAPLKPTPRLGLKW